MVFVAMMIWFGAKDNITAQLKTLFFYYLLSIIAVSYLMMTTVLLGFLFYQAMFRLQRFEHRRHRCRIGITVLTIVLCLFNLTEQLGYHVIYTYCHLNELNFHIRSDFCTKIDSLNQF